MTFSKWQSFQYIPLMKFSKKREGPFALIKSTLSPAKSLLDGETKSHDVASLFQVDQKDFVCVKSGPLLPLPYGSASSPTNWLKHFTQLQSFLIRSC